MLQVHFGGVSRIIMLKDAFAGQCREGSSIGGIRGPVAYDPFRYSAINQRKPRGAHESRKGRRDRNALRRDEPLVLEGLE